jgi:predicted RNase H-like nuclease (RuvC/YqgF family)
MAVRPIREELQDGTDVTDEHLRALIVRAVNATLEQASQIGALVREVAEVRSEVFELRKELRRTRGTLHSLHDDVEDTKSLELRQLRNRSRWIAGIAGTVIAALVVAIALHLAGWPR